MTAFERLRIERLLCVACSFGHLYRDGPRRGVDPFGLVAIGVSLLVRRSFVAIYLEVLFALGLHETIRYFVP